MKNEKFEFELRPREARRLERMADELGLKHDIEVVGLGLSLLEWVIERLERGYTVGAISPEQDRIEKFTSEEFELVRSRYTRNRVPVEGPAEDHEGSLAPAE